MNQAASTHEQGSKLLYKIKLLHRKKDGTRELLGKEKEGLFLGQRFLFWGARYGVGFYHGDCLFFLWGMKRAHMTGYLTGVEQHIPGSLIKITFLVKFETVVRLGTESSLVSWC